MDGQNHTNASARNGFADNSRSSYVYSRGTKNSTPFQLSVDTAAQPELDDVYSSHSARSHIAPQNNRASPLYSAGSARKTSSTFAGPGGTRDSPERYYSQPPSLHTRGPFVHTSGQAELNPVTARGFIASSAGSSIQRPAGTQLSPSHTDRGARHFRSQTTDGAVHQDQLRTSSTAHHPSISTVLSAATHSADALNIRSSVPLAHVAPDNNYPDSTPRARNRVESDSATPLSRRYSQAEFDSYNDRSIATTFGFESQLTRPNFDDSSMYAHTPARDAALATMHVMGRNPLYSANSAYRAAPGMQDGNTLAPESPSMAQRPRRHSRVSSLVSPTTRARRIEDTQNALTSGARASTRDSYAAQQAADNMARRSMASQTWYGPSPGTDAKGAFSDTYTWGAPDMGGRARTGSFALANASAAGNRRSFHGQNLQQQQRGNGLATEAATRNLHRTSYTASVQGSHGASMAGSSHNQQHRNARQTPGNRSSADAGSSFISASARKSRHRSTKPKDPMKTPIRSNIYYKDEMLSESEIKNQEFESSDEEDFCVEGRGYAGDMISQQKLIQKQQRSIFDLNLRLKMLTNAMDSKTKEPYDALVDDFGRTCASNRRANREIEQLRNEVQELKEHCTQLEEAAANPPPCSLPHGMSASDREIVDQLDDELAGTRQALKIEKSVTRQKQSLLEDMAARNNELEETITRLETSNALLQQRVALYANHASTNISPTGSNSKHGDGHHMQHQHQQLPYHEGLAAGNAATTDDLLAYRMRAGTATTTSETLTLRAHSDFSAAGEDQQGSLSMRSPKLFMQEKARLESAIETLEADKCRLEGELKKSDTLRMQLEEEVKQAKHKARMYEDERRNMQLDLKRSYANHIVAEGKSKDNEISRLIDENEALKDECDALRRQVDNMSDELKACTENALAAAVSTIDLDSENELFCSTAQNAEIRKLRVECNEAQNQAKILEAKVNSLTSELEKSNSDLHRLSHDILRPMLRESTVEPTQAETVRDQVRQWSQLKVVLPPSSSSDSEDGTPTKSSGGATDRYRSLHTRYSTAMNMSPPPLLTQSDAGDSMDFGSNGGIITGNHSKHLSSMRPPLPPFI
ncbi:hypothetical protein BX070DRAFT_233598 [Coemansia spiralis]|nr:hypothetical protein BX070DRAFT_233598 [Coemansia spiralis]